MATYTEIMNHDRIQLDELIERHGPQRIIEELKSIFVEKQNDKRREFDEREYLATAFASKGIDFANVDQAVGALFDYHGGAAILEALIRKVEKVGDAWEDADMKKQCSKQVEALRLKSVQKAWGLI